jgi:hypothetical protein
MLRDVAISGDRNVVKKETGKILKYKERTTEIQRMLNVNIKSDISKNTGSFDASQNQIVPEQNSGRKLNQGKKGNKKREKSTAQSTNFSFSLPVPPHVPYGLRGLPSRLWPKCN